MKGTRRIWAVAAGALAIAAGAGGIAAAADQQPAPAAGAVSLEEVVVTANRREEDIQSVPIAVAAFSADTAAGHGITDIQSLANAVPGLRVDRATATALPFLRGVGSPVGQVSAEPSVAIYVDDIYTPAAGAAFSNFNSISSLEVEKGPQGTLFGRNATGGVIQISTRNPTEAPALDASLGYANYDTVSGSIYATGALASQLSANISVYGGNQGSGWGRNVTTGQDAFKNNRYSGGRLKFLWTPTDRTSVLLALDHDTTKSSEGFYGPVKGTVGAGGIYQPAPGFYDLVDHSNPLWEAQQSGASLKITQDLDWAKLKSISAYRDSSEDQYFDQSGAPFPLVDAGIHGPDRTFTQELQLLSPDKSPVSWIAGFFFMNDRSGYDPLQISGAAIAALLPLTYVDSFSEQDTKSYAGFVQATWPIAPDTHLVTGIRYTSDQRSINASYSLGGVVNGAPVNSPQSATFSAPSGRLSLDHKFTPDFMGYVSYNRGFKSGTFNAVVIPPAQIGIPVKPETLDDYSIGEKAEFLDHRLRLNSEAFYYNYKNIQVTRIIAGGTAQSNAAKATITGLDVDATLVPVEGLTITAGLEVLNGYYADYPNGLLWIYSPGCAPASSNCNPAIPPNLKGDKTVDTPPFSLSLKADYLYKTAQGDLDFALGYNHGGDYFFDPDNGRGQLSPSFDKQPVLNLVDASVDWTSPGGLYEVRAWGKNITGQKYISFGFEESLLTQYAPAPPATYGLTVSVHLK